MSAVYQGKLRKHGNARKNIEIHDLDFLYTQVTQ